MPFVKQTIGKSSVVFPFADSVRCSIPFIRSEWAKVMRHFREDEQLFLQCQSLRCFSVLFQCLMMFLCKFTFAVGISSPQSRNYCFPFLKMRRRAPRQKKVTVVEPIYEATFTFHHTARRQTRRRLSDAACDRCGI